VLAGIGALMLWAPRLGWLGRLPGDITIQRGGFSLYLPITTCLVISAALTLVVWVLGRGR